MSKRSLNLYFGIANGKEQEMKKVCLGLHHFVLQPYSWKRKFTIIFRLDAIKLPSFPVLIGHSDMQHVGAEYLSLISQRFHILVFTEDNILYDCINLAYNCGIDLALPGKEHRAKESIKDVCHKVIAEHTDFAQD